MKAEEGGRDFINFCTGRAWVFTDTGTKKEGEKLFQFTHTTFLEYFAASHLARLCRSPQALLKVLRSRITKQEWDVMAQLSFQLQNKKIAGAGDELLMELINHSRKAKINVAWNILSFTSRCLEFIVPRPKVTREIIKTCIDRFLTDGILSYENEDTYQSKSDTILPSPFRDSFIVTYRASVENKTVLTEYITERIISVINNGSELESVLALEVGLYSLRSSDIFFTSCTHKLQQLYLKCFWLCYSAVDLGKLSIAELVKWYSIEGVFRPQIGLLNTRVSLAQLLIRRVLDFPYDPSFSHWVKDHIDIYNELSNILLSHSIPYIRIPASHLDIFDPWWFNIDHFPKGVTAKSLKLNSKVYFTAFVLLSVLIESHALVSSKGQKLDTKQIINTLKISKCLFFDHARWVFCARYEQVEVDKIQVELNKCGFTKIQRDFIWKWIQREINLVEVIDDEHKQNLTH